MAFIDGKTTSTSSTQSFVESREYAPSVTPGGLNSYATYDDFVGRFQEAEAIQISQAKVTNPVTADRNRVQLALGDASDTLDSYLRARYAPGLALLHASPPPVIIRHVVNIARYDLAQNKATDQMRERYDDAIAWCKLMLKPGASLLTADSEVVEQASKPKEETGDIYSVNAYGSNHPPRHFSQTGFSNQQRRISNNRFGRRV